MPPVATAAALAAPMLRVANTCLAARWLPSCRAPLSVPSVAKLPGSPANASMAKALPIPSRSYLPVPRWLKALLIPSGFYLSMPRRPRHCQCPCAKALSMLRWPRHCQCLLGQGTRIAAEQFSSYGVLRSPVINVPRPVAKTLSMPSGPRYCQCPLGQGSGVHSFHAVDGVYAPPSGNVALLRCPVVNALSGDQGSSVVTICTAGGETTTGQQRRGCSATGSRLAMSHLVTKAGGSCGCFAIVG